MGVEMARKTGKRARKSSAEKRRSFCFPRLGIGGKSRLSEPLGTSIPGGEAKTKPFFAKCEDVALRNVGNFSMPKRFGLRARSSRASRFPVWHWASYGLSKDGNRVACFFVPLTSKHGRKSWSQQRMRANQGQVNNQSEKPDAGHKNGMNGSCPVARRGGERKTGISVRVGFGGTNNMERSVFLLLGVNGCRRWRRKEARGREESPTCRKRGRAQASERNHP